MTTRAPILAACLLVALAASACRTSETEPSGDSPENSAPGGAEAAAGAASPPSAPPDAPAAPTRERTQPPVAAQEPVADLDLAVRLGLVPPEPVPVAHLLTHPDIREIMAYQGELAVRSLDGIAPGPNYNVTRLAAGEGYGFALQLWRLDETRQVIPRFERLRDTWIVANTDAPPVGDASFSGEYAGVRHVVFSHRASRSVAAITCQSDLCDAESARGLAERILSRL